jgi:hypothetical protein
VLAAVDHWIALCTRGWRALGLLMPGFLDGVWDLRLLFNFHGVLMGLLQMPGVGVNHEFVHGILFVIVCGLDGRIRVGRVGVFIFCLKCYHHPSMEMECRKRHYGSENVIFPIFRATFDSVSERVMTP